MFPNASWCLFSPRPCSWPVNVPVERSLKDGSVAAAGRVLPQRVGTGIRTRRQALNHTTVLPTIPTNWVRSEDVLDASLNY